MRKMISSRDQKGISDGFFQYNILKILQTLHIFHNEMP